MVLEFHTLHDKAYLKQRFGSSEQMSKCKNYCYLKFHIAWIDGNILPDHDFT